MNRLYISIIIFLSVIAASWISVSSLKRSTQELILQVETCISANADKNADIDAELDKLDECWDKYFKRISFLTRSTSLEELAVSVSRLRDLLDNQGGDFESELNAIKYRALVLYESQLPLPQSIF